MPLVPSSPTKPKIENASAAGLLEGKTAEVRWTAARAAGDDPNAVHALATALAREDDTGVREAIFTALARIATAESVAAVLPYLRSDHSGSRNAALDALRLMPQAVASHMAALLSDPDSDVRLLSCELARGIRGPQITALLLAQIEVDPQPNVCAAAIEVLSEIGDAEVVPGLVNCAARFPDDPFLAFAAKAAAARLGCRTDG